MEDIGIQLVTLVILLALSAFFSSAETSLVGVSIIKIRNLSEEGNRRADVVLKILSQQSKMLSAILIGNNLVNTFMASIASMIAYKFGGIWVSAATFIITFLILVFGEITPKTLATRNAEKLALIYAPIISFLMKVLTPVIWFINLFSNLVLKILGVKDAQDSNAMTESEIRTIVDMSHEEGIIEEDEKDMINNVFDLDNIEAKDVMVPRIHVRSAPSTASYQDLVNIFKEDQFTRLPVYEGDPDNVIGLVNMKDLLLLEDPSHFDMSKILRKPYFTVENKNIADLLGEMKHSLFNMAIVLDEYGELAGIVTVEDIIEEIVGDVQDEYDSHEIENIQKVDERTYDIKGFISLHDINDALDLTLESEDFDSIGGLLIERLGRIPVKNDQVQVDAGILLQVKKMDRNRIEEVRLILPEVVETIKENKKAKDDEGRDK